VSDPGTSETTAAAAPTDQEQAARVERGRVRGVPLRFLHATLRGKQTPSITATRDFLNDAAQRGRLLGLLGPPGVGKSYAGAAAVMAWPRPAWFVHADTIAQAAAQREHGELHDIVERAQRVSLLVLDDLGRLKVDGLAETVVEEILCRRHAELMGTIITSNWTPAEMVKRLSARLLDRLVEWATVTTVPGASLRHG
jgi:DNA replication protein DnaC